MRLLQIQVMPMDPTRLQAEAKSRRFGVTVFRRHALRLHPDMTVDELGQQAYHSASKRQHVGN